MEWLIGVSGLLLGAIGAWLSYHYGRQIRPLGVIRTLRLDLVSHPNLHIRFGNREVASLSLVRFVLWNGGTREIRREDLPASPIGPQVLLPNLATILDYRIAATNGDSSAAIVPDGANQLIFNFDFLNRNDALLGEILYEQGTGGGRATLQGTLKGAPLQEGGQHNLTLFDHVFMIVIFLLFAGMAAVAAAAATKAVLDNKILEAVGLSILTLVVAGLAYVDLRVNVLSIPNKLRASHARFLNSGMLPTNLDAVWRNGKS